MKQAGPTCSGVRVARGFTRSASAVLVALWASLPAARSATSFDQDLKGSRTRPRPPGDFISVGPYVQFSDSDSAVLHWQTEEPTRSIVEFGTGDESMERIEEPTPAKDHSVTLVGLERETLYRFRVNLSSGSVEIPSEVFNLTTTYNCAPPSIPTAPSPYRRDKLGSLYSEAARRIVDETGITRGYCLVIGFGEGRLAYELAKRTNLRIVGIEDDPAGIDRARRLLKKAGCYGSRITVQHLSTSTLPYAGCFANLVVSDRLITSGRISADAAEVFRVLRPCGGTVYLYQPAGAPNPISRRAFGTWFTAGKMEAAVVRDAKGIGAKFVRAKLPGAGDWSHQYADAANTACSVDERTNGPMRIQWFGRPGAGAMIDRGGRTPAPLCVNGRLYVLGHDRLFGQDAYNGAVLWSLEIPNLRRANVPRDCSNMAADDDHLYVAVKDKCWVIDGATGKLARTFDASPGDRRPGEWGYLACQGDRVFGSAVKRGSAYTGIDNGEWYDGWGWEGHKVTSDRLFALDRKTGGRIWTYTGGAIVNPTITIGDGRVWFVECRNEKVLAQPTGRIGVPELWQDLYLVALEADNSNKVWERPVKLPAFDAVFYLSYARNTLVAAGSRSADKKYHVYAFDAGSGQPLWDRHYGWHVHHHGKHIQHPAIVGDTVYLEPCAMDLYSGKILRDDMPMRTKCGALSASASTLFYRNYNNGMWDLESDERTEWPGIRAGCWLNMIPAGGLLLAPESSSGCSCPWPIQTSHAYVPK